MFPYFYFSILNLLYNFLPLPSSDLPYQYVTVLWRIKKLHNFTTTTPPHPLYSCRSVRHRSGRYTSTRSSPTDVFAALGWVELRPNVYVETHPNGGAKILHVFTVCVYLFGILWSSPVCLLLGMRFGLTRFGFPRMSYAEFPRMAYAVRKIQNPFPVLVTLNVELINALFRLIYFLKFLM